MYLGENKTLDVVATSDIGWFGAQGFLEPEDEIWKNKAVGIAGDRLTCKGMKEAYRRLKNAEMPSAYWLSAQLGILRDNNMSESSAPSSLRSGYVVITRRAGKVEL